MDSDQLEELKNCINRYFADEPVFTTSTFRRFEDLLQHISVELPGLSTDLWSESTAAAALMMAGSRRALLPPDVLSHFLKVTRDFHNKSLERMLECAIAYGCGKWRQIDERGSTWEDIWMPSISQLSQAMEPAVKETNIWLSDHVTDYVDREFWYGRDPLLSEGAAIIAGDAMVLALQLVHSVKYFPAIEDQVLTIACDESRVSISMDGKSVWQVLLPGGRIVFELSSACQLLREPTKGDRDIRQLEQGVVMNIFAKDDGARISFPGGPSTIFLKPNQSARLSRAVGLCKRSCTCGHKDCHGRHNLDGWNAALDISLWSYCASAVKGPHVNVHTGTLVQGLYYSMLSTRGNFEGRRVREVLVEYKLCQSKACRHVEKSQRFEGQYCPSCREPGNPATTPRKLFNRVILVGENEVYRRVKRFRCKNDHSTGKNSKPCIENMAEEPVCPICHAGLNAARPVSAWVRVFTPSLSDDQVIEKMRVLADSGKVDESYDYSGESEAYDQEEGNVD